MPDYTEAGQREGVNGPVRVVLVSVAHQPFGLLMSQVYNVIRPGAQGFKLKQQPDSENGREWGEIEYRGQALRVIELARLLHLPLTEPIEYSQILLCGQLNSRGAILEPFGIACDDILSATQTFSIEELRLLPGWLFYKRLGRLIWGAALVNRKVLEEQPQLAPGLPGLGLLEVASVGLDLSQNKSKPLSALKKGKATDFKHDFHPAETQRPVMLLDLEVVRRRLFVDSK